MCATWNIKENHPNFLTEPNKCTEMGFDRLFEPDNLEDALESNAYLACKSNMDTFFMTNSLFIFEFLGVYNLCPPDKIPKGLPKIDTQVYTEWAYDYLFGGMCFCT